MNALSPKGAPSISPIVQRFFAKYSRWYVARHFFAVRLRKTAVPPVGAGLPSPLVIYLNHSSWWDPLIAILLAEQCFPERPSYAPMEARQLERYGIFRKLGVFGVEPGTARGARAFLRAADAVLAQPGAILWITPQARFADLRERPLRFAAGLAALARGFPGAQFVPLAIEYSHGGERLPELFAEFGEPEMGANLQARFSNIDEMSGALETRLTATMDSLAAAVIRRGPEEFREILKGARGVGGLYDIWRRMRALATGEEFHAEHGPAINR